MQLKGYAHSSAHNQSTTAGLLSLYKHSGIVQTLSERQSTNKIALLMLLSIPTAYICQRQQLLQAYGAKKADAAREKNVSIQSLFY